LGTEVGFEYQSPPPLYFSTAILTDLACEKTRVGKRNNSINPILDMHLICPKDKNIAWFKRSVEFEFEE
jgi:hypothetical protein